MRHLRTSPLFAPVPSPMLWVPTLALALPMTNSAVREAFIRVDRERDYFQLKAISLEEENKQLTQELTGHGCRRNN